MKRLSLLFLVFSFVSCQNKYYKETKVFSKYLKNVFNLDIVQSKQIFFVVPTTKCSGCSKYLLNKLKDIDFDAYLITTEEPQIELNDRVVILYDEEAKIDRLDLGIANIYVIVTLKNRIIFIKEIEIGKLNNLFDEYKNL